VTSLSTQKKGKKASVTYEFECREYPSEASEGRKRQARSPFKKGLWSSAKLGREKKVKGKKSTSSGAARLEKVAGGMGATTRVCRGGSTLLFNSSG